MQKIRSLRSRAGVVAMATTAAVLGAAVPSFATADASAVTAVTDSTSTLKDTIQAGVPLILVVTAAWVVLNLAKKLVKKAG